MMKCFSLNKLTKHTHIFKNSLYLHNLQHLVGFLVNELYKPRVSALSPDACHAAILSLGSVSLMYLNWILS